MSYRKHKKPCVIAKETIVYSVHGVTQKTIKKGSEVIFTDKDGCRINSKKTFGQHGQDVLQQKTTVHQHHKHHEHHEHHSHKSYGSENGINVRFVPSGCSHHNPTCVVLNNETLKFSQIIENPLNKHFMDFSELELEVNVFDNYGDFVKVYKFSLYADNNYCEVPYGVSYNFFNSQNEAKYTIDFGEVLTNEFKNASVKIYQAVKNSRGFYSWGDMIHTSLKQITYLKIN